MKNRTGRPRSPVSCESAQRLGIEVDEADALQWLTAMATWQAGSDLTVDTRTGVFGHKVVMLDFSDQELAHFREMGRLVEFQDQPGVVETALALSGSAAQSKIQSYPGDCDYFERVNIKAPTRDEACRILAGLMRDKALSTAKGPTYQLDRGQVRLVSQRPGAGRAARSRPDRRSAGRPAEIQAGQIDGFAPDGTPVTVTWDGGGRQPRLVQARLGHRRSDPQAAWPTPATCST